MNIKGKMALLKDISLWKFIKYNFFSKNVVREGKGLIFPYRGSVIDLEGNGKIILHDGHFMVNYSKIKGSKAECYLVVEDGGTIELHSPQQTSLCYGCTLRANKNARIDIGWAYFNINSTIYAIRQITMGDEVLIARNTVIFDADHHTVLDENGKEANTSKPVIIGSHIWIGQGVTILRGSRIGDGAVIAANTLVGGKIKAGTMAQGNPARSYWPINWDERHTS